MKLFSSGNPIRVAQECYASRQFRQAAEAAVIAYGFTESKMRQKEAFELWCKVVNEADPIKIIPHLQRIIHDLPETTPFWLEAQRIKLGRKEPLAINPSTYEF